MDFILIFSLIILSVFWIAGVWYLVYGVYLRFSRKKRFVPFVPADIPGVKQAIAHKGVKQPNRSIDIGSGWGTIVFLLAERFPNSHVSGVEIHPVLHGIALIKKFLSPKKYRNVHLYCADAASLAYSQYDTVFLFMLPTFLKEILMPKLEKELKKGAQVISYEFPFVSSAFEVQEIPITSSRNWVHKAYIATKK